MNFVEIALMHQKYLTCHCTYSIFDMIFCAHWTLKLYNTQTFREYGIIGSELSLMYWLRLLLFAAKVFTVGYQIVYTFYSENDSFLKLFKMMRINLKLHECSHQHSDWYYRYFKYYQRPQHIRNISIVYS